MLMDRPEAELERHNRLQRAYYAGRFKPRMTPRRSAYLERQLEAMIRFAALRPGERILEVGCGMGRYTLPLVRRGFSIEGLDLSPELLGRLRANAGSELSIPLHLADVLDHPPELAGGFDAVIGFFAAHHFHDLRRCWRAIAGLLRPGGRTAFLEPNPYNPLYYAQILIMPDMRWRAERGLVSMRRSILFEAARTAGLSSPAFERFGFFPPWIAELRGAAKVERLLERVPLWRGLLPFQLFRAVRPAR
jgi:SAM-dependent methyltransferase